MKKDGQSGILFFTFFLTVVIGGINGLFLYDEFRQFRAKSFPQATGTITQSEVTRQRGRGRAYYRIELDYTYRVDGRIFTGNRYRYNQLSTSASSAAYTVVNERPVGATVPVYYNPKNPADAILNPGNRPEDCYILYFATPFDVAVFGLWVHSFNILRRKYRQPVAGGVKWTDDGQCIRVCLPMLTPFTAFVFTTAACAMVSILGLAFTTSFHPTFRDYFIAWGIVFCCGLAVAGWLRLREKRGRYDLVINRANQTVTLPATFGRKERRTVSFAKFSGIGVETIEHRDRKNGTTYTYAVLLRKPGDSEKLALWSDEARANNLAAWLRDHVLSTEPTAPPHKSKNKKSTRA